MGERSRGLSNCQHTIGYICAGLFFIKHTMQDSNCMSACTRDISKLTYTSSSFMQYFSCYSNQVTHCSRSPYTPTNYQLVSNRWRLFDGLCCLEVYAPPIPCVLASQAAHRNPWGLEWTLDSVRNVKFRLGCLMYTVQSGQRRAYSSGSGTDGNLIGIENTNWCQLVEENSKQVPM